MAVIADSNSKIVIQGITGREASMVTRLMIDYGTPVVAGITPGRGGQKVEDVPVYNTLKEACLNHDINTSLISVPPASVLDAVYEAVENNVKTIVITTENVPQHDVLKVLNHTESSNVQVIGPNSVGIISPSAHCKIGAIGGDNTERCFVPGPVGVISRSGGMTAETSWMVKRAGYGVSTSISIGGDALIGSSPKALLKLFQEDEDTQAVIMFSEPGTIFEEEVAQFISGGHFTKPLIVYIAGCFTEDLPEGTVFGHAAAMIEGNIGRPSIKKEKLSKAGAYVCDDFDDIINYLNNILK